MGLFSLISFLIVTSLGTLYPIYLSYKAIKANDLQSLEVLLMYWIVMGSVSALENTFGWLVNWLPFYYEGKTVLMLWLTLPQIQGSTFVYVSYVHPFLLEHESEIDALMVEAKERCTQAGADYLRKAVEKLKELIMGAVVSQQSSTHAESQPQVNPQAAQTDYRASLYAMNLLRQFGPAAVAVFQPMQTRANGRDFTESDSEAHASLIYGSSLHPCSVRPAALAGYQIPEYDHPSLGSSPSQSVHPSLAVPNHASSANLDGRRVSSPLPAPRSVSSPSKNPLLNARAAHSSSGSGLSASGYDEIMQDEASGSETEWITSRRNLNAGVRRRSPITPTGSGAKPRASTGQIPDRPELNEPLLRPSSSSSTVRTPANNSNPSGPGWWFGWGGRPIEEMAKKD